MCTVCDGRDPKNSFWQLDDWAHALIAATVVAARNGRKQRLRSFKDGTGKLRGWYIHNV